MSELAFDPAGGVSALTGAASMAAPSLTLAELARGSRATVCGLRAAGADVDAALLRRLAEIGFVAGEPVRLLRRGPGGREPIAVQVGDTLFALRAIEARCIEVTDVLAGTGAQADV